MRVQVYTQSIIAKRQTNVIFHELRFNLNYRAPTGVAIFNSVADQVNKNTIQLRFDRVNQRRA